MRPRIVVAAALTGTVLVAGGTTALVWRPWEPPPTTEEASGVATVVAERTTLTSDVLLAGQLSYGDAVKLPPAQGTITWLPAVGTVVAAGQTLYEVDGDPVIAVPGSRPFWREMSVGVAAGADVAQLEAMLVAGGFGDLTVDETFTWSTGEAVKAWQRAIGVEATGSVGPGHIVAIGEASVRVSEVSAALGDRGGSALSYTSTTIRVVATLTDAQARELVAPLAVTIRLPDGVEVAGTITEIDPGGETLPDGETSKASAVVTPDDPATVSDYGLRAVKVLVPREGVEDALVVPVTALVATLDGGYAVDVQRDGEIVRIPVELGLIADTRVQIIGGELEEGDDVVVTS